MTQTELIAHLSTSSRYVENALKHAFLTQLFQTLWRHDPSIPLQVYAGEIDAFGHDIVLVTGAVTRHIQLKASHLAATSRSTSINIALSQTPAGCAVWMFYDPTNLRIRDYRFFGSPVGQLPPSLDRFKTQKHVKANSKGIRTERPKIREVPIREFKQAASLSELIEWLFGIAIKSATETQRV